MKKGVTEEEDKDTNESWCTIFRLELQQKATFFFLVKKAKKGCRNDRRHCSLKTASTHQFEATEVKHEILYMTWSMGW